MAHLGFDATIMLNDHHLADAGLAPTPDVAIAAVRQAVGSIYGAGWIDVEAHSYPAKLAGWVILYSPGRAVAPDTADWRGLLRMVEGLATAALGRAGRRH
jgi:hypothetical protein